MWESLQTMFGIQKGERESERRDPRSSFDRETYYSPSNTHTTMPTVTRKKASSPKKTTSRKKASAKAPVKKKASAGSKEGGVNRVKMHTAKDSEKKPLVYAEGDSCFYVQNGAVLTNLLDLREELSHMDEGVFTFHAEGEKNDFACWIEDVLCECECAKKITKAKNKPEAIKIIQSTLRAYNV